MSNTEATSDREAIIRALSGTCATREDIADAILSVLRAMGRLVEPVKPPSYEAQGVTYNGPPLQQWNASECDPKFGVPTDHRHFFHGPPAVTMRPEGATMGEDAPEIERHREALRLADETRERMEAGIIALRARAERAEKERDLAESLRLLQFKTWSRDNDLLAAAQAERDRMREALVSLSKLPEGPRAGCVSQYEVRVICRSALSPAPGGSGSGEAKFCTGCGWPEHRPLSAAAIACCPDRQMRSHRELSAALEYAMRERDLTREALGRARADFCQIGGQPFVADAIRRIDAALVQSSGERRTAGEGT